MSVGAAGCIYPPVESHILADSHISASGGSDDKSHPGGTAQLGEIKCTLDDKVAAAAQNDTDTYSSEFQFSGRNSNEHLPEEGNSQAVEQGAGFKQTKLCLFIYYLKKAIICFKKSFVYFYR